MQQKVPPKGSRGLQRPPHPRTTDSRPPHGLIWARQQPKWACTACRRSATDSSTTRAPIPPATSRRLLAVNTEACRMPSHWNGAHDRAPATPRRSEVTSRRTQPSAKSDGARRRWPLPRPGRISGGVVCATAPDRTPHSPARRRRVWCSSRPTSGPAYKVFSVTDRAPQQRKTNNLQPSAHTPTPHE